MFSDCQLHEFLGLLSPVFPHPTLHVSVESVLVPLPTSEGNLATTLVAPPHWRTRR